MSVEEIQISGVGPPPVVRAHDAIPCRTASAILMSEVWYRFLPSSH